MEPTPDLTGRTVWVIDTLSRVYQLFHALPEMTSPQGAPVSAVYGFTRDLVEILAKRKPDYLLCAMDAVGPTFRHDAFADYKANRAEMPPDLVSQIPIVRRLLALMNVPLVECSGYEADDVLATIATRTVAAGGDCIIATSDKDARQLLSEHVRLFNLRTNSLYAAEDLRVEWGIAPDQVVDFLSLVGDSVDNVPGVPLIGPKVASELIQRFGTLDAVLANAGQVSGKKRSENLRLHAAAVRASRELVRLECDVPVELPWKAARCTVPPVEPVVEFLRELGFKSLVNQVHGLLGGQSPSQKARPHDDRGLFPLRDDTVAAEWTTVDEPSLARLADRLRVERRAAVCAVLAADTDRPRAEGLLVVMATHGRTSAELIPAALLTSTHSPAAFALRQSLADAATTLVCHDLKRLQLALAPLGIAITPNVFDTLVAGYLLDAGQRGHSLCDIAERLGLQCPIPRPPDESAATAAEARAIASTAIHLADHLEQALAGAHLLKLFRDVEIPLVAVLADMERGGIRIDTSALARLSMTYADRLATLEREIVEMAGHPFLISSPVQVRQVLFDELRLPIVKRTKTGASTDAEVLEELASMHPLPRKLLEHRQFSKLKSTYVDALPQLVNPTTGKIHASFNQTVTATGRLSSSNPNLQNIPIRTREGREIRAAFLPRQDDWRFVAADYSQIELRVFAHLSGDSAMRQAFESRDDIHVRTAMAVYGVDRSGVTADMRRAAKAVNFGILYGQSAFGLAKSLGISQLEAAAFIESYFRTFSGAAGFMDDLLDRCRHERFVTTMLGRRRMIDGVRDRQARRKSAGGFSLTLPERTAINTVVQGSAADMIKLAMLNVARGLADSALEGRLVLQIHDELVLECPWAEVPAVRHLVERAMLSALPLSVPVEVSVHDGDTWDACDKEAVP